MILASNGNSISIITANISSGDTWTYGSQSNNPTLSSLDYMAKMIRDRSDQLTRFT